MLTTLIVKNVKAGKKPQKLYDSGGLYLLVAPSGGKLWRWKYRHGGKEKLLALGAVPAVTLADARLARDEARKLLKSKVDPGADRKRAALVAQFASATSFEAVAREWYANQLNKWTERHAGYVLRRMEADLFPDLGAKPIAELEPLEVLATLRKIEARGAHEMARRSMQYVSGVCRYAISTARAKRDVTADLRDALEVAPEEKHLAALTPKELPAFFKKLAKYQGHPQTPLAIRLLMLTGVRTSELLGARWEEFTDTEWRIPAERMKARAEHIVPLSRQALAVLKALRPISGARDLLFPAPRNWRKPMSNNTMLFAFYRMGYHSKITGHGMRTLFSTVLNEQGFSVDAIERQLAHVESNSVRAAYNRASNLPERKKMLQWYADYLTKMERK